MSFLISHVPPAHPFFQKASILENTAKSLPTYFLMLTIVLQRYGIMASKGNASDGFLFYLCGEC